MKYPPAVVIPADRPASLGIARSLSRKGISVYGVDRDPTAAGMVSKYLIPFPVPNSQENDASRLQALIDLGRSFKDKAVLYPVSDEDVLLCSCQRNELQKYYVYVMPEHSIVKNLLTKNGLHGMAYEHDIPAPQVFRVKSYEDVEKISEDLPYPVIFKPVFSPSWSNPEISAILRESAISGSPKVALCHSAVELLETYTKIAVFDNRIIIEEVIPGEDERLTYFCFYLDRQSMPLAIFAGKKLRVLPAGFGSATYVRSFYDPDLEEISMDLLSGVKYQGLGGIEFKKDSQDERYKLIELNARFGMWDSLSVRCGIDIPFIAYCDALEIPVEAQRDYREGVLWVDFQRDMRAFLIYRRRNQLSFADWIKSLSGEKEWAYYSRGDWKPSFFSLKKLVEGYLQRLKLRLPLLNTSRS